MGAHFLAIKDMAGLCRPYAAHKLVKALKEEIGLPIHFHTHDTSGVSLGLRAQGQPTRAWTWSISRIASMSGSTSQPNLNSIVAALQHTPRDTGLDLDALNEFSDYWEHVREFYAPFDTAPQHGQRRGLSARDARRPVHEPEGAGRSMGGGASLAGNRAHLRRGEPALRRHRQGDAVIARSSATWRCSCSRAASSPPTS